MIHFAKVSGQLERIIGDIASQYGECDPKVIQKWRHTYRDAVRPLYRRHVEHGISYMSEILSVANDVKNKIEQVYRK